MQALAGDLSAGRVGCALSMRNGAVRITRAVLFRSWGNRRRGPRAQAAAQPDQGCGYVPQEGARLPAENTAAVLRSRADGIRQAQAIAPCLERLQLTGGAREPAEASGRRFYTLTPFGVKKGETKRGLGGYSSRRGAVSRAHKPAEATRGRRYLSRRRALPSVPVAAPAGALQVAALPAAHSKPMRHT